MVKFTQCVHRSSKMIEQIKMAVPRKIMQPRALPDRSIASVLSICTFA